MRNTITNRTVDDAVDDAVDRAVDRAVSGAVWWAVSGALYVVLDQAMAPSMDGAVSGALNDPDHPALWDFLNQVDPPRNSRMNPKEVARACVAEVTRTVGRATWVVVDDSGVVAHESEADARRAFNRAKIAEEPKPVYLYKVEQVGATFSSLDKRKK